MEGMSGYVIANDEEKVRDYIDKELNGCEWENNEHPDYLKKMLQIRGEYNEDDIVMDDSDLYYGLAVFGWDEGIVISDDLAEKLINYGIAVDLRDED
jgi:hypothetical protein